jgi:hypothetical protein
VAEMTCSSTFPRSTVLVTESWPRVSGSSSRRSRDQRDFRPNRCDLPRRGSHDEREDFGDRRDRSGPRSRGKSGREIDEDALALRDRGLTYSAVARSLGIRRAVDAHAAFLRALRQRHGEERVVLAQREAVRLDELENRIRTRDASDPTKTERRLVALAKLRDPLVD